jgi:DNA-binding response OmpR family regulator
MSHGKLISRVLIVDDESLIADTLAIILRRSGFEVVAVYSGEQAIDAAKMLKPDILISDVMLGGITGIETACQILQTQPDCEILLISGQASIAGFGGISSDAHGFDVLAKPIHPQVILDRLNAA